MPAFIRASRSSGSPVRTLDVRPDDTDSRDYIFAPSLVPLPPTLDRRRRAPVLDQGAEGACVGFALATVVNTSLAGRRGGRRRLPMAQSVSPRMLYQMGRRHDEWAGESYEGTSLRGAMKGWHKHGVTTAGLWPYRVRRRRRPVADRQLTPTRATDALRRPIGAYYRIVDSDVSHVQAAVFEGDAVLASAWIHAGWEQESLVGRGAELRRIAPRRAVVGLHAFAIVGYTPAGFLIQNSWGPGWGTRGCALLPYDDWFENRQDAWVARPGPETRDSQGSPRIFVVDFAGAPAETRAGTSAAGLDLHPEVLPYLINTGDRGALSPDGALATAAEELPAMAERVLLAPALADGHRHVVLYAHGGLNGEEYAAGVASRLSAFVRPRGPVGYFFVWESGLTESILGWLRSDDDASGPARLSWADAWETIKTGASETVRAAQRAFGQGLAPIVREMFWGEMQGRAQGASASQGGAARFVAALFDVMARTPHDRYKLHLVAHSAGGLYLAWVWQQTLRAAITGVPNVSLASIHLMAPALTIARTHEAFIAGGQPPVPAGAFRVHTLSPDHEDDDSIQIYPSSLLTYVADHLESPTARVPLLGIRRDLRQAGVPFVTHVAATASTRHGQFDDESHEVETALADIAKARW